MTPGASRAPGTPRGARGWWRQGGSQPAGGPGGPICYTTKRAALRAFITDGHNAAVLDEWGGIEPVPHARGQARAGKCAEFDPINARYGLTGRSRVCLLDDAIWAALREGGPRRWCLDKIDLAALNEVGRLIGGSKARRLQLPDVAEAAIAARREVEEGSRRRSPTLPSRSVPSLASRLYACDRDAAGRFVRCRTRKTEVPF